MEMLIHVRTHGNIPGPPDKIFEKHHQTQKKRSHRLHEMIFLRGGCSPGEKLQMKKTRCKKFFDYLALYAHTIGHIPAQGPAETTGIADQEQGHLR
jgi:hypothetical protein